MMEGNKKALVLKDVNHVNVVLNEIESHECYANIIYYLKNLSCLDHLVDHKRRALRLKATRYCLTRHSLGWKNLHGIVLRCVNKDELKSLMEELHVKCCGGHYSIALQHIRH